MGRELVEEHVMPETTLTDLGLAAGLRHKVEACVDALRQAGRVAVAASGGVDSTLVLALAAKTLAAGDVLAVTARGPLYPPDEPLEAQQLARQLGVEHVFVEGDPLAEPGVAENPPDRCYHCKRLILGMITRVAAERGMVVATGDNADDPDDYRPGLKAVRELGVLTPLLSAGLTKPDIRAISAALGLPTADRPSAACLASRIPYGQRLTPERLTRIAEAERVLHGLGFGQCRVRDHEPIARIEVLPADVERVVAQRETIVAALKDLGYGYVAVDLQGFRSGSLNEALDRPESS